MTENNDYRKIELVFNNYVLDKNNIPNQSGIYVICRGNIINQNICISEVLYIGESEDMHNRLANKHEKIPQCTINAVFNNEILIYFYALVPNHDNRELAEKALIFKVKPKFNDKIDLPIASKTKIISYSNLGFPQEIVINNQK